MKQYDYLIVGAGLFGAVFAHEAKKAGKKCLVIDKRDHIAGNIYTENVEGINVHRYGAHIFHTNNKAVWQYVNQFAEFNRYTNSPVANYHGEIYNLPFNMNTFNKMWGVVTPAEAKAKIEEQKAAGFARLAALEQKIRAGESDQKIAYLTFDDGPYDTVTDRVLDILAEKEVRATFFLRCRPNHEVQIRREIREGHTIANHSYSHKIREVYRSADSCIDEVRRQQQWLSETFGVTPEIYRFPGGSPTARGEKAAIAAALAADGLGYVDWNCATGDGLPGELTRDMAYKNAIQSVGEQKIVVMLMHDYSAATTDALPQIIDTLREKGYLLMPLFRDSVMIKTA